MSDRTFNVLFLCTGNSSLPLASIDSLSLGTRLRDIGRMDGGTIERGKAG